LITSQTTPSVWGLISGNIDDQFDLKLKLDNLNTRIDNIQTGTANMGNQFVKDIVEDNTVSGTTRLIKTLKNPQTGSETNINIDLGLASSTNSGIMPSSAFNQIETNKLNISTLQGVGRTYPTTDPLPETLSPTQLNAIFSTVSGGGTPNEHDILISYNSNTLHYEWIYYTAVGGWYFRGVTSVNLATNSVAGIVVGDVATGNVSMNLNGTMTANGLSNAITDVTNLGNRITTVEGDVSNIVTDISNVKNNITTINGNISSINGSISTINGKIVNVESDLINLDNKVNTNLSNLGGQLLTNISEDNTNTSTTRLVRTTINPINGNISTSNLDLGLASSTNSGIMPSSSFNQIEKNKQEIEALKGVGRRFPVNQNLPNTLSQS